MTIGEPDTGQWTGTGWICMDPDSGAAGYIISGNNNGGATYESWPPEFIDLSSGDRDIVNVQIKMKGGDSPDGDSPDPDAIYTRDDRTWFFWETHLVFEYRVHVTYDDGTTKILPGSFWPWEYYRRETRNTVRTFAPGNYRFRVWISRWPSWARSSVPEAERNVSIVGVFVRGDDGTPLGTDPPRYVLVRPPSGAVPSVKAKALVIPEKAPDNTTTLATGYKWSNGGWFGWGKLVFEPDNAKSTAV